MIQLLPLKENFFQLHLHYVFSIYISTFHLDDLRLFPCLSCGGFQHVISDIIMWFSSGGTKSVIHNDHVDNINCLFSGVKELYMVDQV